jgi:SAM-dependent methyltransferase
VDPAVYDILYDVEGRHWWYVARRRILEKVLGSVIASGVPKGILYDLGCGVGANLPVLKRFGETVGVDASSQAVAYCRQKGHENVVLGDLDALRDLPEESGSIVLLADVIEHLDDESACLSAAWRLLKPGGALIVTVPAFEFLWSPMDDLVHHRRRYREETLQRVLAALFEVEYTTYFNTLLFAPVMVGHWFERILGRNGADGGSVPPAPINRLLRGVFSLEASVLGRARLPFGVSLLAIARKDSGNWGQSGAGGRGIGGSAGCGTL